jgi:VIT1/CCC1 family predicted Fe2+/Mn2+ transporter
VNHANHEELRRDHRPEAIQERLSRTPGPQNVSDAVLGGIDGCITTFAVVSGAVGAGFSSSVALVLGFANLVADGFSMAASNYESIKAQRDFIDKVRRTEEDHVDRIPGGERDELREIFRRKGFEGDTLEEIVRTISQNRRLWVETMLTEEHGLQKTGLSPWKSALATMAAFLLVGAIPLTPLFASGLEMPRQFALSALLAGISFFSIGTLKSLVFAKPVFRSGLGTLLTGGTAAGLAYLTGYLLQQAFGIG